MRLLNWLLKLFAVPRTSVKVRGVVADFGGIDDFSCVQITSDHRRRWNLLCRRQEN